jgi:hypothetical protein
VIVTALISSSPKRRGALAYRSSRGIKPFPSNFPDDYRSRTIVVSLSDQPFDVKNGPTGGCYLLPVSNVDGVSVPVGPMVPGCRFVGPSESIDQTCVVM